MIKEDIPYGTGIFLGMVGGGLFFIGFGIGLMWSQVLERLM
jgi:hypothetical protein